uniref:Lipoprotein n=1 Tax=Parastrongyloides trichosuri TaxID=131310 RepID=A0A0N4ZRQ4_PARTI
MIFFLKIINNVFYFIFIFLTIFIYCEKIKLESKYKGSIEELLIREHFKTNVIIPHIIYEKDPKVEKKAYELYGKYGYNYFSSLQLPLSVIELYDILKGDSFEVYITRKIEELEKEKNVNVINKIKSDIKEVVRLTKEIINSNEYKDSIGKFKAAEKKFAELDFKYMENVLGLDVMYHIASNVHIRYPRELYLLCGESINERDICKKTFNYLDKISS